MYNKPILPLLLKAEVNRLRKTIDDNNQSDVKCKLQTINALINAHKLLEKGYEIPGNSKKECSICNNTNVNSSTGWEPCLFC